MSAADQQCALEAAKTRVRAVVWTRMGMGKPGTQPLDRVVDHLMRVRLPGVRWSGSILDAYVDDVAGGVIDDALAGDADAREALKFIATAHLVEGRDIPQNLARYLAQLEAEGAAPSKTGTRPDKFRDRDLLLPLAIWMASAEGFKPTRNKAKHSTDADLSACAIVSLVLEEFDIHMAESTIEGIWNRRNRDLFGYFDQKRTEVAEALFLYLRADVPNIIWETFGTT